MRDAGRVPVAGPGEEVRGSTWPARCCLAVVIVILFVVVVLPVLIWAAGILIGGGR